MRAVRGVTRFWWDFIIGDDWLMAAGVIIALTVVGILAQAGVSGWWLLPPVVVGVLGLSLRRAVGPAPRG